MNPLVSLATPDVPVSRRRWSLRGAGISAGLYLRSSRKNALLKSADKRGPPCAVIQGSNERDHRNGPQVTIRDLVLGAELAASTKDHADYLELRANAQFTVAEAQLVESVRKFSNATGIGLPLLECAGTPARARAVARRAPP